MTSVTASLASQHHAPVLTVNPGVRSLYRIAFAGGATFEAVADCDTAQDAARMLTAASDAVVRLGEIREAARREREQGR